MLPKNEKTFTFDKEDGFTGQKYSGEFTVKCVLTFADRRVLELEKSRLRLDILNPTSELLALTTIQASLKTRIISAPSWWKESDNGNNILDSEVVITLFDKVMEQEDLWVADLKQKSPEGN